MTPLTPLTDQAVNKGLSVLAFGKPSNGRTFSGYAKSITSALKKQNSLRNEYSIKDYSFADALKGAISFNRSKRKFEYSRAWMWTKRGNKILRDRLIRKLHANNEVGPILQIGTLVDLHETACEHFVLTDMTILQAVQANQFAIKNLIKDDLDQAIKIQAEIFSNAKHIFTLSNWTANAIQNDYSINSEKTTAIYAGTNTPILNDGSKIKPHNILFIGIDWERKGGPMLLEAFDMLSKQIPNATLTIIGCSPEVRNPGIKVIGFLDKAKKDEATLLDESFRQADCFCLPSHFDPFPNAIIEALHASLPCVAIDNGSRREAIKDGYNGKLAPKATAESLAEALHWVISDQTRIPKLRASAKSHAMENFTWEIVLKRLLSKI